MSLRVGQLGQLPVRNLFDMRAESLPESRFELRAADRAREPWGRDREVDRGARAHRLVGGTDPLHEDPALSGPGLRNLEPLDELLPALAQTHPFRNLGSP